eukprot:763340-Hanusia_phi.AAC.7
MSPSLPPTLLASLSPSPHRQPFLKLVLDSLFKTQLPASFMSKDFLRLLAHVRYSNVLEEAVEKHRISRCGLILQ